jgi:type 1 glutamine amidotransferase
MKRNYPLIIILLLVALGWLACNRDNGTANAIVPNVLIFTKTRAFRHECIEPGVKAMQVYFSNHGITSVHSEDSLMFSPEKLKSFDAVMFFQTTGNVLDSTEQDAFKQYVRSGKGFVGIHAAADTEYDWPWFGELLGARFANHPDIQAGALVRIDSAKIATAHLPARWTRTDEWYNFKQPPTNVHVELMVDEATYSGGTMGANHPMAWYHNFEGGRAYYTALGHTVESYQDTLFLEHLMKAVKWAAKKE